MVIPVIWASRKDRKWPMMPIFPALITALTVVPVPLPVFLTRQSTGRDISSISSPLSAARWSMSSASLNANLDTGKPCTADSGRMRTVCTRCLPVPIYTSLPGSEEASLPPGKGHTAPFYRSGNDDSPHKLLCFSSILPVAWNISPRLLPFV